MSPLGIVLILLIIFFFNRRKFYVFLSLLILLISTNPFVGNYLAQKLESPYKPIPISSVKENDAVVVLSGMLHQVGDQKYSTYEFGDPNRFFAQAQITNSVLVTETFSILPCSKRGIPQHSG